MKFSTHIDSSLVSSSESNIIGPANASVDIHGIHLLQDLLQSKMKFQQTLLFYYAKQLFQMTLYSIEGWNPLANKEESFNLNMIIVTTC